MQKLLELDEPHRAEIGDALLESHEEGCFEAAQQLLATVDDGLTDDERAQLHADLEASLADMDAGKTIPFDQAMASLRALRNQRAAR